MRQTDARKLTQEQLTELRKRGVMAVQQGESPIDVARVLGVGVSTLFGWLARYRNGGWDALEAKRRGGRPPKLDASKLQWIWETVTMKEPRQLKFPFALWTSGMIREVVKNQFGITLSKTSVCRVLHQLGLSPQKPLWRAYQKDPARVQKWLDEEYPAIKKEAEEVGAEIFFQDEAGVRSDFHSGTTWAPRGQTPEVSSTGARFSINIISAVSARGSMRFMTTHSTVNAEVFIVFLKRLLHDTNKPVFLIVDGHPSHRAKKVSRFVEDTQGMLKLFFLPGYSPELNPDEQVWNDLKNSRMGRITITGRDQLRAEVKLHLRRLQRKPERVRSFFRTPETAYAA